MFIHNLITYTLGLVLIIGLFIVFTKQILIYKEITLRNGEKKQLSELNWLKKSGFFFLWFLSLIIGIIMFFAIIPYIKDFSIYNNNKYEVIDYYNVENVRHIKSSRKASSFDVITIDGIDYKIESATPIKEGDTVKISYLPNTKIIIDFKIYNY
ncbi:hypothetical protein [Clostridium paridis]|uniref:Uncharacterized protein n=1 Tax=Clostridium paridis TaxID=2803863 RepID=A0A937FHU6_9CLOT|nr:hypothetical protein [Clostridium paridis]MBL4931801.1 hypothetical protein [Clostridium paridis]